MLLAIRKDGGVLVISQSGHQNQFQKTTIVVDRINVSPREQSKKKHT